MGSGLRGNSAIEGKPREDRVSFNWGRKKLRLRFFFFKAVWNSGHTDSFISKNSALPVLREYIRGRGGKTNLNWGDLNKSIQTGRTMKLNTGSSSYCLDPLPDGVTRTSSSVSIIFWSQIKCYLLLEIFLTTQPKVCPSDYSLIAMCPIFFIALF